MQHEIWLRSRRVVEDKNGRVKHIWIAGGWCSSCISIMSLRDPPYVSSLPLNIPDPWTRLNLLRQRYYNADGYHWFWHITDGTYSTYCLLETVANDVSNEASGITFIPLCPMRYSWNDWGTEFQELRGVGRDHSMEELSASRDTGSRRCRWSKYCGVNKTLLKQCNAVSSFIFSMWKSIS